MPGRSVSHAQQPPARETSSRRQRRASTEMWTKRLSKRVVQKADGRYLIYFEKI
jgi:hypothetical protein